MFMFYINKKGLRKNTNNLIKKKKKTNTNKFGKEVWSLNVIHETSHNGKTVSHFFNLVS